MTIAPLSASPAAAQLALLLQPDPALSARLQVGQIVQGQVLRHYEGSRYLVRLLGQDAVVDSATPLRPNDILRGRVTALKDRIELERLDDQPAAEEPAPRGRDARSDGGSRAGTIIEELFQRYRAELSGGDAVELERAVRRATRPERTALAGLVLSKLGLPIERDLLEALTATIDGRFGELAPAGNTGLEAETNGVQDEVADVFALDSKEMLQAAWAPTQWVLNAQGGGSVAHRVASLPLQVEGAELRVEYALFEEGEGGGAHGALRHRKAVLVLDLDALGRVEARAVTAGGHVRVALATDSRAQTNALLRYGETLENAFDREGWTVDEIAYETRAPQAPSGAVAAAVEHIVTPGSVSRLA